MKVSSKQLASIYFLVSEQHGQKPEIVRAHNLKLITKHLNKDISDKDPYYKAAYLAYMIMALKPYKDFLEQSAIMSSLWLLELHKLSLPKDAVQSLHIALSQQYTVQQISNVLKSA